MVKKKKVTKDKNIGRFFWKEGDIEIIQPKTKKKATKKTKR